MGGYLLDTHAAFWLLNNDKALSNRARRIINDLSNSMYISIASVWELAIKIIVVQLENYDGGHKVYKYGGHPAPDGASPTQPYKCGQNVKVKTAQFRGF